MDTSDPDITFNDEGICNYCTDWYATAATAIKPVAALAPLLDELRGERCLLGISGGVDSSFVAFLADHYGLDVVLTHFDNGFDTPEGQHNVDAIVKHTEFPYVPQTCDLDEIYDLKRAYLRSGVLNIEVICDQAQLAATYRLADELGITTLLSGTNWATEGILPKAWGYPHHDVVNLRDIHRHHGTIPLRTFPTLSVAQRAWLTVAKGIRRVSLLNYVDYRRDDALHRMRDAWGFQGYGLKHWECICTRFYQCYIHPYRTGWDKRRAHFSTMICSGQMTRDEALRQLQTPITAYPHYAADRRYFCDRLGITDDELQMYLDQPITPNSAYHQNTGRRNVLRQGRRLLAKVLH